MLNIQWLLVSGEDSETFLQGQLTNDIRQLQTNHWQLTAHCSAQGKVLAVIWLWRDAHGFWLGVSDTLAAALLRRLRLFILRSKVKIECVDRPTVAIAATNKTTTREIRHLGTDEIHLCGIDGVSMVLDMPSIENQYSEAQWRAACILSGIAQVYPQTADIFLPQLLGLHEVDAVSFQKGCYIGQENIARLQYKSQQYRFLCYSRADLTTVAIEAGAVCRNAQGQAVGNILDSAMTADGCVLQAVLATRAIGLPLQLDGFSEVLYFTRYQQS